VEAGIPDQPAMERELPLGSGQNQPPPSLDDDQSQKVSALELENSLLNQEMSSLNQETNSVIKRAKSAQEGK